MWAVVVFALYVALDFVWARYIASIGSTQAKTAALWAAVLIIVNGAGVIAYTEDHWLLIPAAFGASLGTFLATSPSLQRLGRAVRKCRPPDARAAPRQTEWP